MSAHVVFRDYVVLIATIVKIGITHDKKRKRISLAAN